MVFQAAGQPGCDRRPREIPRGGPNGSLLSTRACNLEVPCSSPGRAGYLSSWLCILSVPTVQRHGVYSAAYGTAVYYKEPLKSFKIRVGKRDAWGVLLSRYFHDSTESDVKQHSLYPLPPQGQSQPSLQKDKSMPRQYSDHIDLQYSLHFYPPAGT